MLPVRCNAPAEQQVNARISSSAGTQLGSRWKPPDGTSPPALLHRLAALLISAGRSVECGYNVAYARVTRPTTEHRNLPDVHHSVAIREHRREYERRFVAFFEEVLL